MKKIMTSAILVFLLSSCAHNYMRGTVAMKTTKTSAHVCLGDNDVKVGEKLDFYTNQCTSPTSSRRDDADLRECKMIILGSGVVTKIMSSHYSEVQTDGSFSFSEGTLVQKQE